MALRRISRQIPRGPYDVAWEPGLAVPAADGSAMVTDHYLPVTSETRPTILVRSPYGRGFPWDALYGVALAEHGFHVVIQSCRGTAGSQGTFRWCRDETADGLAAVAWLREQRWFSGVLGTIGPSYLGYTQWALAAQAPPELRAAVVQVGMHKPYEVFYPGGVFALANALIAGVGTAHWQHGFLRMTAASVALQARYRRITRTLPLTRAFADAFGDGLPLAGEVLGHQDPDDPYWQQIDLTPSLPEVTVPTALAGGWDDLMLDQTIAQYRALRAAGQQVALLIGPWTHTSAMNEGGRDVFGYSLDWLRTHLVKDGVNEAPSPVRVRVGGSGEWLDLPDWPPPARQRSWHLDQGGRLRADPPGDAPPSTVRYDPNDPTPSIGGQVLGARAGAQDNRALEARPDVLTFTSEPLERPLQVIGAVRAQLHVSASKPGTHVFARLCDVDDRGRSRNVCDGIVALGPDVPDQVTAIVAMSSTAHQFAPGHRIRLQVSGGAFPRFARNTGTGESFATAKTLASTDITLWHDQSRDSALILPVAG
jgi:uncharacterized protein